MQVIQDYNFYGKIALIRVDFNVPLTQEGTILDGYRIDKSLPTIKKVLQDGGRAVLISHLGRPSGSDNTGHNAAYSLSQLVPYLHKKLAVPIHFFAECVGDMVKEKINLLQAQEVLLLENVRFHPEEEKGDAAFAKALAQLGDVYVNDAFGTAHRKHASTYFITQYMNDNLAGYLLQTEIAYANKLLKNVEKPFTAIVGGAKIGDKMQALANLLPALDYLLLGGGIANTFLYTTGHNLGKSLIAKEEKKLALDLLAKIKALPNVSMELPSDFVIADQFSPNSDMQIVKSRDIPDDWMTLDVGPQTCQIFENIIEKSRTILWIGPIGVFEFEAYSKGTVTILKAIAKATEKGAFTLIGGGDTATALHTMGNPDQVTAVSTGGSALLAYLVNGTLPAILALETNQKGSLQHP